MLATVKYKFDTYIVKKKLGRNPRSDRDLCKKRNKSKKKRYKSLKKK